MSAHNDDQSSPKKQFDQNKKLKRNEMIIKKIKEWQEFEYVKPLICKKTRKKLVPKIHKKSGKVCLRCPESNYVQWSIPEVVLNTSLTIFDHAKEDEKNITIGLEGSSDEDN